MIRDKEHDLMDKIEAVLRDLPLNNPVDHHFGRPFLSARLVAIELERRYPGTTVALGLQLAETETGQQVSLAQYIARQLSIQISTQGDDSPIEGAFLSMVDVDEMRISGDDATPSGIAGLFDLSMFRLRA